MPPTPESPEAHADASVPPRQLGRVLLVAFGLFFLMVGTGVFWVWHRFSREKAWRDQVNPPDALVLPASAPRR